MPSFAYTASSLRLASPAVAHVAKLPMPQYYATYVEWHERRHGKQRARKLHGASDSENVRFSHLDW
jgi:hypothetical protein